MDAYEKMMNGELYSWTDEELTREQTRRMELLYDYNATRPSEEEKRERLLKEMFGSIGKGCHLEPPLHANWAGMNVHLGDGVYANFNLTLVDDCTIKIGSHTMIAPSVTICTATHPIMPELRAQAYQYNLPIEIGENVWLGAGVIVLAGVKIGDNSVIGAGSVVNKDIPANVVAVGTPCRVLRPITDRDRLYYNKDRLIPEELRK